MKLTALLLLTSLSLAGCSALDLNSPFYASSQVKHYRIPASNIEEIGYYLSLDKFKYYVNEYTHAQEGKVPDQAISYLRRLDVTELLSLNLDQALLKDALNYDKLIWRILKDQTFSMNTYEKDYIWGYNFFKNKLNEAFNLVPTKLHLALTIPSEAELLDNDTKIKPRILSSEDMTLDSGHYISNRTTRAIFWDANQNNRPIEFHLGDSRNFLKELKEKKGELLFEVKPFAKNYNKIYIIKYPNENTYRYAITNIGGQDRLDHLTHQISLSNFNKKSITTNVSVKGNIRDFHAQRIKEHVTQLNLLPHADRVIIGQKESIDSKFNIFWKINALNNLKSKHPALYELKIKALKEKELAKLHSILNGHVSFEAIFKEKKVVEDLFVSLEKEFETKAELLPYKFKQYNFDNFTIEMSDYVFIGKDGKPIRWRILSNVWGDEILPVAQALKKTGHNNITYIGTAGAFAGKDHKVGDLISPRFIYDENKKLPMLHAPMKIEGAKHLGSVEHVGSPFEESKEWLLKAQKRSDFVEVETSYLRRTFNTKSDKLEVFLLISDILGSETETLAHATSAKRKNAQNKLLAKLFERDVNQIPKSLTLTKLNNFEKNKKLIADLLIGKSESYKYYVYSVLKKEKNLSRIQAQKRISELPSFTDHYLLDRLVKIGEFIQLIDQTKGAVEFDLAFSKSLIEGTWNPKSSSEAEILNIQLKVKNPDDLESLQKIIAKNQSHLDAMKAYFSLSTETIITSTELVWQRNPEKIDPDFLVKIYAEAGTRNFGLYQKITYNGNLALAVFPTTKSQNVLVDFLKAKAPLSIKNISEGCKEAVKSFFNIL